MNEEDLKNRIQQQVYNNFVNSLGYNGCSIYDLGYDCTQDELLQCLIELIKEGEIEIITGDVGNTYIKSFDAESIEKQITQLPSLSFSDYSIYPTERVLENKRDVSSFNDRPFSKMLALGKPQLRCCFFNIDILRHYATDPRYDYRFRDYFGSIYSYDSVEDSEAIYLNSFSIGRNGDDYVVAVFLRDLNFLPAVAQQKWYSKMIVDSTKCKVLKNFLENQLLGSWCFPRTVFRAIIEEIENLYVLTNKIWGKPIVSNYYLRDDDRLRNFEMLLLPTSTNLDDFYRKLEIITVENLNKDFFCLDEFGLDLFSYTQDGDYQIKQAKGTLQLLKEWLQIIKPESMKGIHGALNKVRAKRSQGEAHRLLKLEYSKEYYTEQFDISGKVFNALNVLRRIIQTHPRAKGVAIPHDSNYYIEI